MSTVRSADDPYRHLPTLGEFDLQLIAEGRHERLWTVLGARPLSQGVAFAVWAPNARRGTGDRRLHRLGTARRLADAVDGRQRRVGAAASRTPRPASAYKYRILGPDGVWRDKADPLAGVRRGAGPDRLRRLPVHLRVEGRRLAGPAVQPARRTGSR